MNLLLQFADLWWGFVVVLVALVVYSIAKEKMENKRIETMQTDQIPLEQRMNQQQEVTEKFQPKKKSSNKTISGAFISNAGISGMKWKSAKSAQVTLSKNMIEQLRSFHTSGFLVKTIVKQFFPEQAINQLVEKALKGELEPGMVVNIDNGKLTLTKP